MGSNVDLRKFQSGKGAMSVEDAFAKVISGGRPGYKTIIEKRKYPPKCEKCSRDIPKERLEVAPEARVCLKCAPK